MTIDKSEYLKTSNPTKLEPFPVKATEEMVSPNEQLTSEPQQQDQSTHQHEQQHIEPRRRKSSVHELTSTAKYDAGLRSADFYKRRLSPLRFKIRSMLLPLVEKESPFLANIQEKVRGPYLDLFFMYTANLGSHTFYVLLLPAPAWFGYLSVLRDLVHVLGLGIYFTGWVKDYLCLPRPKSPPLHRLTLSSYTAEEYGCPSSHTANATSVVIILLWELFKNWSRFPTVVSSFFVIGLAGYWTCLVLGRVYCGMHGFVDISLGACIGIFTVLFRKLLKPVWDDYVYSDNVLVPITLCVVYYALIYFHTVPVDACPCFEDGIAFIGVLIGLDIAHWAISNSPFRNSDPNYPCSVPYSYEQLGIMESILRFVIGVGCVVIWKAVSKPLLLKLLKPIHHLIFGDVISKQNGSTSKDNVLCWAFVPRHDLTVFVRLIVYAGVAAVTVCTKILFTYLGLGVEL
ncbi:unnamed protein product [Ambrosiozyma monospora]|uniref:Unnamed protein product n=1 Tax=Ambrosiozyma monospora TaxID=43982 RepID=A0A9W7DHQ1_AMBMO|nr:unnamed protein product [Ambrosiozyma monospora]